MGGQGWDELLLASHDLLSEQKSNEKVVLAMHTLNPKHYTVKGPRRPIKRFSKDLVLSLRTFRGSVDYPDIRGQIHETTQSDC